jgi:hypothetical protein
MTSQFKWWKEFEQLTSPVDILLSMKVWGYNFTCFNEWEDNASI